MGKSIKEKCKENGITLSCYYYRIYKLGYTPAQALSTPKQKEHATKKELEDRKVFEEDFQKGLRRGKQAQVQTQLKKLIRSGGIVSPNKSVNQVSCSYRPAGPSVDFDKACGGYQITILNHVKEGETRFNILRTGDGKIVNTNNPDKFIEIITNLTNRYFGR